MFVLSTYTIISLPRTPDCVTAEASITEFFGETQTDGRSVRFSRGSLGFHGIGVVHAKGSLEVALPPTSSPTPPPKNAAPPTDSGGGAGPTDSSGLGGSKCMVKNDRKCANIKRTILGLAKIPAVFETPRQLLCKEFWPFLGPDWSKECFFWGNGLFLARGLAQGAVHRPSKVRY